MFKILKVPLFKNYIFISFIIYFIFNIGTLDNLPFSDDIYHIFNHSFLRDIKNPLNFFNPWSEFFKSWGLTYTYFWVIFSIFGKNILVCKILNLILHFFNHILFKKYLSRKISNQSHINILALIFLFSPLSILTTNWIFQAKTLLSVLFLLLFLIEVEKIKSLNLKNLFKLMGLFFLTLTAKVVAILIPLYTTFLFYKRFSIKKSLVFNTPLVLIALVYGLLNIKGITYIQSEIKNLKAPAIKVSKDHVIPYQEKKTPKIEVFKEVTQGAVHYFGSIGHLETFKEKYIVSVQNLGRLFLLSIGLNNYLPFYESNLATFLTPYIFLYSLIGFFFIYLCLTTNLSYPLLILVLFLPISGFFYVPYMKYSFTSDHWFYPAGIFIPFLLLKIFHSKKVIVAILTISILNFSYTVYKNYNFSQLLRENYAQNKNPFILEVIAQENTLSNRTNGNFVLYSHILKNEDFNNPKIYKTLLELKNKKNAHSYQEYYGRFAVDQIRSGNLKSLNAFAQKHDFILNPKQMKLTGILGKFYNQDISDKDLVGLKHYLKEVWMQSKDINP